MSGLIKQKKANTDKLTNESGKEIGNSLEFDFIVPPPHLCKSVKEKIRKNLALFALSKSYNDILDVD